MKYLVSIILVFSFCSNNSMAQEASIEKSVWGIQALMLPLSVYNETKLTNSLALRSELAWGFSWSGGSYLDNANKWAVIPYLSIEPRYYLNLNRRSQKGKRIDGNSGNYLSLYTCFQPGFGITSGNVDLFPATYIIPTYGLRRNMGKRFNFEVAFGVGYGWEFEKLTYFNGETYHNIDSGIIYNIRLALGYLFKRN